MNKHSNTKNTNQKLGDADILNIKTLSESQKIVKNINKA